MMTIEPIDECIYDIDDILSLLSKADKWTGLANRLSKLLTQKFNTEQTEAIRNAIRFFSQGEGENFTKAEVDVVIQDLEDKLGARIAEVFRKDVLKFQLESYVKGHIGVGIQFLFNTLDKQALRWLFEKDVKQFWIGESYSVELNEALNNIAAEVMKSGMGRTEAGNLFKQMLGDQFQRSNSYWELMSNHIITRAREFGKTSAYEKSGIEYIKLFNPNPISPICKYLNGRIIPVGKLVKQRDKLLTAETMDQVKAIAPWYKPNVIESKIRGVPTNKLPKGIGLPPFHPHCFPSNTLIQTSEGLKEISNVKKGDKVLTHKKHYKHVETVFSRDYIGVAIKMNNSLICTPEHPILIKRVNSFQWIEAKNIIIGDIICRLKKKE